MKLLEIQQKLKAPKGQFNAFGKYKYRSCEDILEAVKLHLSEPLKITDEIIEVGGRIYVKASVTYGEDTAIGYAREPENKKGMDESQITGAASSYARKSALSALFLLDDTKDADSMDNRQPKIIPSNKFEAMVKSIKERERDKEESLNIVKSGGYSLTDEQTKIIKKL